MSPPATQQLSIAGTSSLPTVQYGANGYGPHDEEGAEPAPSTLLRYLPAIYSADPFVGRFLRIFEDVLDPVSEMVDNQPYYFDPMTTPIELLDYMAQWVDMDDEGSDWALAKRRALIQATPSLYRMRGTKPGLRKHLGIYVGSQNLVLIQERTNGFRLDGDARLGMNTSIGINRTRIITVTVVTKGGEELDPDTLMGIVENDKPVETNYVLRVFNLETRELRTIKTLPGLMQQTATGR